MDTPSILDRPLVAFGREVCGDLEAGLRREWLVTNGLGGYASGSLAGPNTRRYHGLLVAALAPPVERTVLVGAAVEWAGYDGKRYPLFSFEYADGTIDQHGYRHLQSFALEGALPVWTYALADALLEKRVWMAYGANTTYVSYRLLRGTRELTLEVTPLVTYRDFHVLATRADQAFAVEPQPRGAALRASAVGARPFQLLASGGSFTPGDSWFERFFHRVEAERGFDDTESDMYAPGTFAATLPPGERWTLVYSAEPAPDLDGARALAAAKARQRELLRRAKAEESDPVVQQLVLAADQFIVHRNDERKTLNAEQAGASSESSAFSAQRSAFGRTVIAGYHWFNDWGRDTMIALPGLTLATGRPEDAAGILRTFARYVADGLLPNNFPDSAGVIPGYNTVDATLWYAQAVRAYHQATGDDALVDELLPVLREIAERHIAGTRYRIHVDPSDGLLYAGEPGVQLTWMDAKIGDWVITPRIGKPVEINALWYSLLRTLAEFLRRRNDDAAARYDRLADQARDSFRVRFAHPDREHLADVVDAPDGDDWTLRPNQIFAAALAHPLLDGDAARRVVDSTGRALLTSYGLRSLDPADPAYCGTFVGTPRQRDSVYHQGPVWTWPIGAFVEAHYRVYGDREAALALLRPFEHHLRDGCLGSVSEILEGDPPHLPRGAAAQAWGVSEVLRVWRMLESGGE
ncbi:MAG: glycogen debranching enzyme family protein [Kouleothrix sp.]|nr:glycogen debranching enzyme family protein [Kouleothrix sp.]